MEKLNVFETFKDLMEKRDEYLNKWIRYYKTKDGFSEWFNRQLINADNDYIDNNRNASRQEFEKREKREFF